MSETNTSTRGPRELQCPECGHWVRRRPGDVYGCTCGCFTRLADTEAEALALAAAIKADDPAREVVVDYD